MRPTPVIDEAKFWSKVQIKNPDECWPWLGSLKVDGYGSWYWSNRPKETLAHRIAWIIKYGLIPRGICVCHHCDNPKCCNPNHLFLGTQTENIQDAIKKGRLFPDRIRGERCHTAKLNPEKVREIREQLNRGMTYCAIARRYGVWWTTVRAIGVRQSWKHV